MIIIKYYEWLKILPGEKHPVWEICNDEGEMARAIDRDEAKKLIKENNMKAVVQNRYGVIYKQ